MFRRLSPGAKFDTVVTADLFLGERLRKISSETASSALKSQFPCPASYLDTLLVKTERKARCSFSIFPVK